MQLRCVQRIARALTPQSRRQRAAQACESQASPYNGACMPPACTLNIFCKRGGACSCAACSALRERLLLKVAATSGASLRVAGTAV